MAASVDEEKPLVVVTGASGFIGSHVVKMLLEDGFRVRGTVRDPKDARKTEFLKKFNGAENLEIVRGDLSEEFGWDETMRGAEYVVHLATPVDRNDAPYMVGLAESSTKMILGFAVRAGVRRVVHMSSTGAVCFGHDREKRDFGAEDWTKVENVRNNYVLSKARSEKIAWETCKGGPELVTIIPPIVLGPLVSPDAPAGRDVSTMEFVIGMLAGEIGLVPDFNMPIVDVRDVTLATVRALTKPEAASKRFLLAPPEPFGLPQMAAAYQEEFPEYNVPNTPLPYCIVCCFAPCSRGIGMIEPHYGKPFNIDTKPAAEILDVHCRPGKEGAIAAAHDLIRKGVIPDKTKK